MATDLIDEVGTCDARAALAMIGKAIFENLDPFWIKSVNTMTQVVDLDDVVSFSAKTGETKELANYFKSLDDAKKFLKLRTNYVLKARGVEWRLF